MADTHEKKVEKRVAKEPAPKAPVHGQEPAPKAPEHARDAAPKPPSTKDLADEVRKELESAKPVPVKKVEARPVAKTPDKPAEKKAEPKPAPKAEPKPEASGEKEQPATTSEAGRGQAGRGQSVPGEALPAGEAGEVEAEIVEEPGEKEKAEKPKKKKGKKKERKPHIKPQLSAGVVRALALRKELKDKTPDFIRQEAYNYGRLGKSWRKPRGTHSKLRHHIDYRINVVSIGYGGPNASKGLHPSGFREVLVHHPLELDKVDPGTQAARIAHGVGVRKRMMIEQRAQRKGIRVLNEMQE